MLAVPFSAVGAIWLLYLLGYNMSIWKWHFGLKRELALVPIRSAGV
jgi:hypothetical protein